MGAVQWKLFSPHFKNDTLESVRASLASLAIKNECDVSNAVRELEHDAYESFYSRSAKFLTCLCNLAEGDIPPAAIIDEHAESSLPPVGGSDMSFDVTPRRTEIISDGDADSERGLIPSAALIAGSPSNEGLTGTATPIGSPKSDYSMDAGDSDVAPKRDGEFQSSPAQLSMAGMLASPQPKHKSKSRRQNGTSIPVMAPRAQQL